MERYHGHVRHHVMGGTKLLLPTFQREMDKTRDLCLNLSMCRRDEVVCNLADFITWPVPTVTVHHGRQFLAVAATDGGEVAVDDIDGVVADDTDDSRY